MLFRCFLLFGDLVCLEIWGWKLAREWKYSEGVEWSGEWNVMCWFESLCKCTLTILSCFIILTYCLFPPLSLLHFFRKIYFDKDYNILTYSTCQFCHVVNQNVHLSKLQCFVNMWGERFLTKFQRLLKKYERYGWKYMKIVTKIRKWDWKLWKDSLTEYFDKV